MNRAVSLLALAAGCGDEVTYHRDVAPVLQSRCVACHTAGGIAPFALDNYREAADAAAAMTFATASRIMPPWGVDHGGDCQSYAGARWLTDDEIRVFAQWEGSDLAQGDAEDAPPRTLIAPAPLEAAAVLDTGVEYTPNPDLTDDYRCFITNPGITQDQFLTGYRVIPGEPRTVHHIILFTIDSPAAESFADTLEAMDPEPGYTCFGGSNVGDSRAIAGWAPGVDTTRFPAETGIRLLANRRLVMQIHYNLRPGSLPDRTVMELELTPTIPKEAFIVGVADQDMMLSPGLEHTETNFEINLAALGLPVGVFLRGVFPHMHELGTTQRLEVIHEGQTTCAARVDEWDFAWQQFYFYEDPVYLFPTDTVKLTCGYDTRSRTTPTRWGEGTTDEMCLMGLYATLF